MENASRAIIMVGGMLIAILVTSLLIFMWNNISDYNKKEDNIQTAEEMVKFNKEFESYNKSIVRGYELISLNNLIADTNTRYSPEYDGYNEIIAFVTLIKDTTLSNQLSPGDLNNWTIHNKTDKLDKSENRLSDFINKFVSTGTKDFNKIFKESYFQCDNVVYDGEIDSKNGKGRIQELYFTQIKRND